MARDDPQVNIRMPAELKERLENARSKSRRSLTAEIIARLESSFSGDVLRIDRENSRDQESLAQIASLLEEVLERIKHEIRLKNFRASSRRKNDEGSE